MEYSRSEALQRIGETMINSTQKFRHLVGVNICYLEADGQKKSGGKTVFADTHKVSGKWKAISGIDFVITFYADSMGLDIGVIGILMEHELMHVGFDVRDGSCFIVPHDVDDFREIIEKHGFDWIDGDQMKMEGDKSNAAGKETDSGAEEAHQGAEAPA